MAAIRPFLFERRFDQPEAPEPPAMVVVCEDAPPVPEKLYDDDDLARARADALAQGLADGRAQGRAEALAEAEASVQHRLSLACQAIAERLAGLITEAERARTEASRDGIEIAVAIARKLLPEYCRRHATTEIAGVVGRVLDEVRSAPRLIIRSAADASAGLLAHLQPLADAAGFTGELIVVADADLAHADCRLEWSAGGAERSAAGLWGRIDALVERALAETEAALPAPAPAPTPATASRT